MAIEDLFNSIVTLRDYTEASDDIMGRTRTYTSRYTSLRAGIQPRRGGEFDRWNRDAQGTTHVLYLIYNDVSDLLPEEDWQCIDNSNLASGTYNIKAVRQPSQWQRHLEIDMERVR